MVAVSNHPQASLGKSPHNVSNILGALINFLRVLIDSLGLLVDVLLCGCLSRKLDSSCDGLVAHTW